MKRGCLLLLKVFFLVLGDYYEILKEKENHCMEWKVWEDERHFEIEEVKESG